MSGSSNSGLHLDFEVLQQWSKMVQHWGTQKGDKKQPPTYGTFVLELHLRTARAPHKQIRVARGIEGTLLMGCVRASGAPDSSRSQKRLTRCFRERVVASRCEPAACKKTPKVAKLFSFHAREPRTMATSQMKTSISHFTKPLLFSSRIFDILNYFGDVSEKTCGKESYVPGES